MKPSEYLDIETIQKISQGKDKVLFFRLLRDEAKTDAKKMLFQTEHTFSYSRDQDSITTKDGRVLKDGGLETEVSIEAVRAKNDPINAMLKYSVIKGLTVEVWEVTVDEELIEGNEAPAVYARGKLSEWEDANSAEDESTVSSTLMIEQEPQFGTVTIPQDILEILDTQYKFLYISNVEEV